MEVLQYSLRALEVNGNMVAGTWRMWSFEGIVLLGIKIPVIAVVGITLGVPMNTLNTRIVQTCSFN